MTDKGGETLYWDAEDEAVFLAAETKFIKSKRKRKPKNAIALSGGGIRSATFSLGALQAFARAGVLERMDYMSTVSGGGYLGGSLQWWWNGPNESKQKFGAAASDFPYGIEDPQENATMAIAEAKPEQQSKILDYLRSHGNYLIPGRGIGIWSGIGILSRAIILNLILWLSLATGLFWLLIGLSQYMQMQFGGQDGWLGEIAKGFTIDLDQREPADGCEVVNNCEPPPESNVIEIPFVFAALLSFAVVIAIMFVLFSIIYSLSTFLSRKKKPKLTTRNFNAALAALRNPWIKLLTKYGQRRSYESVYQFVHPLFYGLLAIGIIPLLHHYAIANSAGLQGLFMTGAGIASALWGYFRSMSKAAPSIAKKVALPIGSLLFLYGISILAYQLALYVHAPAENGLGDYAEWVVPIFYAMVALSLVMMVFVNINYISPHRFYRDRIMEAFMPAWSTVSVNSTGWSPLADKLPLSMAWPGKSKTATTPFPLINTNVVLVNQKPRGKSDDTEKNKRHRRFRMRGGDNFLLTPFASGSLATGWRKSADYMRDNVTLASAVAISGAAANPDAAYLGNGHSRDRFVSIVMRLFNLRLGYWVANPRYDKGKLRRINHFRPGLLYAVTNRGHKSKRPIVELTDGGHFDNLGVYELIRRRAKVIIVCDGEADKKTSYAAFVSLARRIEEDFKVKFEFKKNRGPELLVEDIPMLYPSDAKRAKYGYFVAKIHYSNPEEVGIVIYLKATMILDVSLKTKGYKGAHPDFPDETTADQFFDEEQFEAYRELGFAIAKSAIERLKLEENDLRSPEALVEHAWTDDELIKESVGEATVSKGATSEPTPNDTEEPGGDQTDGRPVS